MKPMNLGATLLLLAAPLLFCVSNASAVSLAELQANNTSASSSWTGPGQSGFNWPPANTSKLPIRPLLYEGSSTRTYAHIMPWFCTEASTAGGCPATCPTGSDGWKRCHGHIIVGYDSNSTTTVNKQVTDMINRGFKGAILYWAGNSAASNSSAMQTVNEAAQKFKAEAEARGLDQDGDSVFEFAIQEDGKAVQDCDPSTHANCPCYTYNGSMKCDRSSSVVNDLKYIHDTFMVSPRYMKKGPNNQPVVLFYSFQQYDTPGEIDWDWVRGATNALSGPDMYFIFRNKGGFTHEQSNGAFDWDDAGKVAPGDPSALIEMRDFYESHQLNHSAKQAFGAAYPVSNDLLATWGSGQTIDDRCGLTWIESLAVPGENDASLGRTYYGNSGSSPQLDSLQLITWNDYEEGTEMETGINPYITLTASIAGSTASWTTSNTSGQNCDSGAYNRTTHHFEVWVTKDGGANMTQLGGEWPVTTTSVNLADYNLTSGSYAVYVRAVGQNSIQNKLVAATGTYSFTQPATFTTITSPASAAAVSSENLGAVITASITGAVSASRGPEIWIDGTRIWTGAVGATSVNQAITLTQGRHRVVVQAYDSQGSPRKDTVYPEAAEVFISSPASGATVTNGAFRLSGYATPITGTIARIDVWWNGVKQTYSVHDDVLDFTNVTLTGGTGTHNLTFQAYDSAGKLVAKTINTNLTVN